MVAVRMVSEGVDVPRLMVGVYATSAATPLYFAQAVGRFVRTRRPGETASIFLPSVPRLLSHAAELERERDHVLRSRDAAAEHDEWMPEDAAARAAARRETEAGPGVQPLTSEATLDRVVFDGGVFESHVVPADAAEEEFLGIPGLLEPDQVAELLRGRRQAGAGTAEVRATRTAAATLADLRAELNSCARAYARQRGVTPAIAHSEARRATGGPPAAQADAATLQARIDVLRRRAVGR